MPGGTGDLCTGRVTAETLPAILSRTVRLAWDADRRALLGMLAAQVTAAVLAALALTMTTRILAAVLEAAAAYGRHQDLAPVLHGAAAPAAWTAGALAAAALADTAARAAAACLAPRVFREADLRVLDAAAGVELIAYEHPGFEDRLEVAGKGAESARDLVLDVQSTVSVLAQLAAVITVVAVLNPLLTGLLRPPPRVRLAAGGAAGARGRRRHPLRQPAAGDTAGLQHRPQHRRRDPVRHDGPLPHHPLPAGVRPAGGRSAQGRGARPAGPARR